MLSVYNGNNSNLINHFICSGERILTIIVHCWNIAFGAVAPLNETIENVSRTIRLSLTGCGDLCFFSLSFFREKNSCTTIASFGIKVTHSRCESFEVRHTSRAQSTSRNIIHSRYNQVKLSEHFYQFCIETIFTKKKLKK